MRGKRIEIVAAVAIIGFIVVLLVFGVYPDLREGPRKVCMANFKKLSSAIGLYAGDCGGVFPLADNWATVLATAYSDDFAPFVCPEARPTDEDTARMAAGEGPAVPVGYSLFAPLAGMQALNMVDPALTPVFFDSTKIERNSVSDCSTLAFRHLGKTANIVFADGHAASESEAPDVPASVFEEKKPGAESMLRPMAGGHEGHGH